MLTHTHKKEMPTLKDPKHDHPVLRFVSGRAAFLSLFSGVLDETTPLSFRRNPTSPVQPGGPVAGVGLRSRWRTCWRMVQ